MLEIRARFAVSKAADAAELDQAMVRLAICSIVALYLLGAALWDGTVDQGEQVAIALVSALVILSVAHIGWILGSPGVNHLRRREIVLADMGAVTLLMLLTGRESIRDVIAFPKAASGHDPLTGAPTAITAVRVSVIYARVR